MKVLQKFSGQCYAHGKNSPEEIEFLHHDTKVTTWVNFKLTLDGISCQQSLYGKLSSIPNEMYVVALHAVHFLPFRGYISIEGLIFIYVAYTKYTRVGPASTLRVQRQIILVL